jgi:hypothetical protein
MIKSQIDFYKNDDFMITIDASDKDPLFRSISGSKHETSIGLDDDIPSGIKIIVVSRFLDFKFYYVLECGRNVDTEAETD